MSHEKKGVAEISNCFEKDFKNQLIVLQIFGILLAGVFINSKT